MWHLKSAVDHAAAIRRGEVTSAALAEYYIDRIERLDGDINAVVVRMFDQARARAREADAALAAGRSWGALHGVPVTVKEAFWVEGTLSTCAVAETIDFVATSNAPAVQSYLDAGAVILGKTNLPVAAADFQSFNDLYVSLWPAAAGVLESRSTPPSVHARHWLEARVAHLAAIKRPGCLAVPPACCKIHS